MEPATDRDASPAIKIRHLSKNFGNAVAVRGLNLDVPRGSIFALVGPNGAGKTTTLDILATLLRPTSGWAMVEGASVLRHQAEIRRVIGYMPDRAGFYEEMKVCEYLRFFADIFEVKNGPQAIGDILELTDLASKINASVHELSRGMRQRLALARCLVHDPKVLLLDEPAAGLDPPGRRLVLALLEELRNMGKTVLLCSHILREVGQICDGVGVIENGELLLSGSFDKIRAMAEKHRKLQIEIGSGLSYAVAVLDGRDDVASFWAEPPLLHVHFSGNDEELAKLFAEFVDADVEVASFNETQVSLEDLFMTVTRGTEIEPDS